MGIGVSHQALRAPYGLAPRGIAGEEGRVAISAELKIASSQSLLAMTLYMKSAFPKRNRHRERSEAISYPMTLSGRRGDSPSSRKDPPGSSPAARTPCPCRGAY